MQARRVATALLVLLPFSAQPACRPSPTTGGTQAPTANAAPATDTPPGESAEPAAPAPGGPEFKVQTEQFGDTRILRSQVPGFEALPLRSKQLVYYLYRAALAGRDIIWDQNYRHNLLVRRTLEAIVTTEATHTLPGYDALLEFTKRMWFSNGIHHHYSMKKLVPTFTAEQFEAMLKAVPADKLPDRRKAKALLATLKPVLFDPKVAPKRVNLDPKQDLIQSSATNYYAGVTQKEVEAFYRGKAKKDDPKPISWGLNSQLAKRKGKLVERTWKVGGMYDPAIREIVKWLELAAGVAENDKQKLALEKLVAFYRTGELSAFDDYSIAWVADTDSVVDVVNGFIEVYGDPLGYRGAWESVVSIRDMEASKRIAAIGAQAQWFEDHAPIAKNHRKAKVTGISAKVILAVVEAGDSAPSTPIGINLPNANWVRAEHGSKSATSCTRTTSPSARAACSRSSPRARTRSRAHASGATSPMRCTPTCTRSSGTHRVSSRPAWASPTRRSRTTPTRSRKPAPISSRSTTCPIRSWSTSAWPRAPTSARPPTTTTSATA
jgi:dipeptidyl-peptidase-3